MPAERSITMKLTLPCATTLGVPAASDSSVACLVAWPSTVAPAFSSSTIESLPSASVSVPSVGGMPEIFTKASASGPMRLASTALPITVRPGSIQSSPTRLSQPSGP